jgi:ribulose kinase
MADDVVNELGLSSASKVAVGSSIIDAHAGVLAMLVLFSNQYKKQKNCNLDIEKIFTSIAGTSTCHMVLNRRKIRSAGIWGPYFDVILKDYYVREPGQTATGKLLEQIVRNHPDYETLHKDMTLTDIFKQLNREVRARRETLKKNSLHVNPSFHGNRCPLADPLLRGGIYGIGLEKTVLSELYEAAIEALAYETKFIIEELRMSVVEAVVVSGGLLKNDVYMQIQADVLGTEVTGIDCGEIDMMLAGAAIMAKQAAQKQELTLEATNSLSFDNLKLNSFHPNHDYRKYHDAKYKCYREFISSCQRIKSIMADIE